MTLRQAERKYDAPYGSLHRAWVAMEGNIKSKLPLHVVLLLWHCHALYSSKLPCRHRRLQLSYLALTPRQARLWRSLGRAEAPPIDGWWISSDIIARDTRFFAFTSAFLYAWPV